MAQHANHVDEGASGATLAVPSDLTSEDLGFECLNSTPPIEINVVLPEAMVDLFLDKELEEFLDRVMATGILIY